MPEPGIGGLPGSSNLLVGKPKRHCRSQVAILRSQQMRTCIWGVQDRKFSQAFRAKLRRMPTQQLVISLFGDTECVIQIVKPPLDVINRSSIYANSGSGHQSARKAETIIGVGRNSQTLFGMKSRTIEVILMQRQFCTYDMGAGGKIRLRHVQGRLFEGFRGARNITEVKVKVGQKQVTVSLGALIF